MHTLITGFGDIGRRVAKLELALGHSVTALIRDQNKIKAANDFGVTTLLADLDKAETLTQQPLERARVYYFAPPPASGTQDTRISNWLESIGTSKPRVIIYISTTGVYGDCKGEWVTEQRPPNPTAERAKRRLNAEARLSEWGKEQAVPIIILRVPGIYHPDKLPMTSLLQGKPILQPKVSPYSNRIHADDLAQICLAAAERGKEGEIYNIADNDCCTMSEYFIKVANAFNLPRPQEINWQEAEQQLSSGMLSYLKESRRIDNQKILNKLKIELQYPTLNDGLKSMSSSLN